MDIPFAFENLMETEESCELIIKEMMKTEPDALREMLYDRYHENDSYNGIANAVKRLNEAHQDDVSDHKAHQKASDYQFKGAA